jgi:two-component sensor histidine kinase
MSHNAVLVIKSKRLSELGNRAMDGIRNFVLPYRWVWMALFASAVLVFETLEHSILDGGFDNKLVFELFVYSILLPLIVGGILTLFMKVDSNHSQAETHLDLSQELDQALSLAQNWEGVRDILLQFPLKIAPFSAIVLLLYDDTQNQLNKVGIWLAEDAPSPIYPSQLSVPDQFDSQGTTKLQEINKDNYPLVSWPEGLDGRCLPLFHGELLVALVHLFLPDDYDLAFDQIRILESLAAPLSIAIDGVHPQGSAVIRATAAELESRRLARYLHDIIGQNLGLLVMRLDYLQMEEDLYNKDEFKQELAELHHLANKSYEQIRVVLTTMQPLRTVDLMAALYEQALLSSDHQTCFQVKVASDGQSRNLPPTMSRKILGISREAIVNVSKHANAERLSIHLDWAADQLTLTIQDDGCGFSATQVESKRSRYGLKIMNERALEMNGSLDIQSVPEQGTTIRLSLPLSPNPVPV